jgi:phosphate/sulfate permease
VEIVFYDPPEFIMGGILSLILIILGAVYFFSIRLSGNKKALEQDDFASGAAWFVVFVIGIFISLFILSFIGKYFEKLDQPLRIITAIAVGLILIYIPYRIACWVAPAKDQEKNNNEKRK